MPKNTVDTQRKLAALTSQCVKCGLCLPACPTFQVTDNEAASPRGRVAISEHIIRSATTDSAPVFSIDRYIDDCLQCQACENACPAKVNVREIISLSKSLRPATSARRKAALLAAILQYRFSRRMLAAGLRIVQQAGVTPLLSRWLPDFLRRSLRHALPVPRPVRLPPWQPAPGATRTVAIHTGCLLELHDGPVIASLVRLLHAAGFNVWIPPGQTCCGALAYHNGRNTKQVDRQNVAAFRPEKSPGGMPEAILSLNTGCGAYWHSHSPFSIPVKDATAFVAEHCQNLTFSPCSKRIFLHQPCSGRHGLKVTGDHLKLLNWVPKLEVITATTGCCGAAGSYFLSHPNMADQLGTQWAGTVSGYRPELVLMPNTGCAMQWQAHGQGIPQQHPLTFLAALLSPHTDQVQ